MLPRPKLNGVSSRRNALLFVLPLVGFIVLLVVFGLGLKNDPSLLPSMLIDKPLPEFRALRLDEESGQVTHADLQGHGRISLINIWATWCPTCRAEHEFLNELKRQGVVIYGVNYKDEADKARQWLQVLGDPYQINIDDSSGQIGIDLGVYGAPETFLLDDKGVIRYRHVGALDQSVWNREFIPRIRLLQENS